MAPVHLRRWRILGRWPLSAEGTDGPSTARNTPTGGRRQQLSSATGRVQQGGHLSLIHISEPTRLALI
eukprot:7130580-Alexandrium_andersonii.AAC.1